VPQTESQGFYEMDVSNVADSLAARMTAPGQWPVGARSQLDDAVSHGKEAPELRQRLGEFVGNVFYGTLIRQMHASTLKGEYFHGGRGEEVFQAQLGMELAQRLGRAVNDPIADRLYESWMKQQSSLNREPAAAAPSEAIISDA